jgi:hypothetical protein
MSAKQTQDVMALGKLFHRRVSVSVEISFGQLQLVDLSW